MRWMNDRYARTSLTDRDDQFGLSLHLNRASAAREAGDMGLAGNPADSPNFRFAPKYDTAFAIDGVGDLKPPVVPQLIITTDNVPGDNTTTQTVIVTPVGGAITDNDIIGSIDTIGDQDFFQVTLTAGTAYEFHLYSHNAGPNAAGLTDPYLELYAPNGTTMLVSADGGADTVYNQANSGFDVLLVYTPTESGTFYVNARAFSNSPATPDGDSVGDYMLAVRAQDPNDPTVYRPYYEPTEPLYAIDWGTQVNKINQSVRNPDGDEGTRTTSANGADPTGNPQGTPTYTSLIDVPALAAAQGKDITDKNVITIYFAKVGDVFASNDPTNPGLPPATVTAVAPQQFERDAVFTSLAEFEKVADVIYLEVQNKDHADFIYTSYQGTPGPGVSLLGSMSPPDESDEGMAQFNSGDSRWNATDLQQGGFSFVTLIHEFGHGHGLAHPHDNGGHSGIMNGVVPEGAGVADYTTGDYDLNQGVFTMMSYEDGWQTSPHTPRNAPTTGGYGYLGGLMAFDIAAIQDKYGVNEDYNIGNDTYIMKDVNAAGTYYYSIWDGGGTDAIAYGGARNATIDLRAATLAYEYGGGGNVSFALGIYGGFTIANGVTIEYAFSGSGNDTLIGNAADNYLDGGAGHDTVLGGAGNDGLVGAGGNDFLFGDTGNDWLDAGEGDDFAKGGEGDDGLHGGAGQDVLHGEGANDWIFGDVGNDLLFGGDGNDTLLGADGDDYAEGGIGNDNLVGHAGNDGLVGNVGGDMLFGEDGNDWLDGGDGDDFLEGGSGNDALHGGAGSDMFAFAALGAGNVDMVLDFVAGTDKIGLLQSAFAGLSPGPLASGAFVIGAQAQDADDRIVYNAATGALLFDADGAGGAAAVQFASLQGELSLTSSDFVVI